MSEQKSKFRFLTYKIVESNIKIDDTKTLNGELSINIAQTQGVNIEENKYKHILGISISDEDNYLKIGIKAYGVFEFDSELTKEQRQNFFDINAPAILFPYIRAYVTTLTSLSGFPPIILPTINLAVRNQENNLIKE